MTEEQDAIFMSDPSAGSVAAFIEGLTILAAHMPNGPGQKFAFGAEHDCIHFWGETSSTRPSPDSEDGRRLLALGFHVDADVLDQWQHYT